MIVAINSSEKANHPALMRAMFKLRAEVFHERLGWEVSIKDGLEVDRFDDESPLYLLCLDDYGRLKGCLRLLPTTGPNMLRDVFSILMPPGESVESPLIWESTRFCVSKEAMAERSSSLINRTTAELLSGLFEYAQLAGLSYIVSVYDGMMKRILDRAGCHADIIGTPQRIGKVMAYAGLFEVSDAMIARIQQSGGLSGSVLTTALPERVAA